MRDPRISQNWKYIRL